MIVLHIISKRATYVVIRDTVHRSSNRRPKTSITAFMSYHIEEIDIGATMNNLFTKIKRNVFYYSKLFEELAVNDQSEKFFRYKATINNVSSNIILQNNDLTIDLIFDIGGTSITWLSVQASTIPNSGKGCFLPFDGKE